MLAVLTMQPFAARSIGTVAAEEERARAALFGLGTDGSRGGLAAAVVDGDVVAGARERERDAAAYSARRAGDERCGSAFRGCHGHRPRMRSALRWKIFSITASGYPSSSHSLRMRA